MKTINRVTALLLFVLVITAFAEKGDGEKKQEIISAIHDGANYACDVLLDESGKSRCDYNLLQGKWFVYEAPWHTGQIIYGLLRAHDVTGTQKYLNNAKRAGDWWVGLEIKDHPVLKGMVNSIHGDYIEDQIVFATTSDGTAGLFYLYDKTGDEKYARVPTQAGQWMLEHMYVPSHGVFYDVVDAKTGQVLKENSPFWEGKEDQKLYDVSRPNNEGSLFKDMYEYSKDEKYNKVFIELCESLVEKQGPEGLWMDFMPNDKESGSFHPRFNLWYAESLLEGYELTGDKRYLEAALKTGRLYSKFQQPDGTIYYKNYLSGKSNRNSISGSTVAFAGIVWLRLLEYGVGEEFKENIEKSLEWTLKNRFSTDHPDKNLAGSFFEIRTRRKDGLWITLRDIATSFSLRFLADYYDYYYAK